MLSFKTKNKVHIFIFVLFKGTFSLIWGFVNLTKHRREQVSFKQEEKWVTQKRRPNRLTTFLKILSK